MSHGERTPSERELAMLGAPPPEQVFVPYGAGALTNVSIFMFLTPMLHPLEFNIFFFAITIRFYCGFH